MEKISIKLSQEQLKHIKNAYKYIEMGIDHCPSIYDLEVLGFFGSVIVDIQSQLLEASAIRKIQ